MINIEIVYLIVKHIQKLNKPILCCAHFYGSEFEMFYVKLNNKVNHLEFEIFSCLNILECTT